MTVDRLVIDCGGDPPEEPLDPGEEMEAGIVTVTELSFTGEEKAQRARDYARNRDDRVAEAQRAKDAKKAYDSAVGKLRGLGLTPDEVATLVPPRE